MCLVVSEIHSLCDIRQSLEYVTTVDGKSNSAAILALIFSSYKFVFSSKVIDLA